MSHFVSLPAAFPALCEPSPPGVCLTIPIAFPFLFLFLFPFPIPSPLPLFSPSHPQSPSISSLRPLLTSVSLFLSHSPACPPHCRCPHFHCHCRDGCFHCSPLQDLPSAHHNHPCPSSDLSSVVSQPGNHLVCTASSLAAQSLPWDHHYRTKRNPRWCI